MVLTLNPSNFTLDTGVYYSDPFLLESNDSIMSVEVILSIAGNVSLQYSINKSTWYDAASSTFSCSPMGLQSFADCQPGLFFRLKSTISFISANILL